LANILFFSRQYALTKGHSDPTSFLYFMASLNPTADLICGWGDGGAFGRSAITQNVFHVPAHRQPKVVDTVGAGDTLIAGVIHGLMCGKCLFEALQLGVRLAGIKCGQIGYDNLVGQLHT
jgi:ketohexokinase